MPMYKYYKPFTQETNRAEWLVYMDHMIACGRQYAGKYPDKQDFMCLSREEHRRLTSLLFQDNTLADREEIMTSFNRDELSYAIIGYIESDSIDAEKRIATIIASNILRSYELVIVELFEQVRAMQTPPENAALQGELIND